MVVRSRVYETVLRASVCPSVCLSAEMTVGHTFRPVTHVTDQSIDP